MSKEKPILFNTEMVQAILEGRKTQTRRILKEPFEIHPNGFITKPKGNERLVPYEPPYSEGDILWVRETWQVLPSGFTESPPEYNYIYAASDELSEECSGWRPSIHMPREAARIFLKITDVRVERLQDITEEGAKAEGIQWITKDGTVFKYFTSYDAWEDVFRKNRKRYSGTAWQNMPKTAIEAFAKLWDSCYKWPQCWSYNPWVWVIEFERMAENVHICN